MKELTTQQQQQQQKNKQTSERVSRWVRRRVRGGCLGW